MAKVKSNLRRLVDKKSTREMKKRDGKEITYRDIRAETGINLNTVTAMMNDQWLMIGRGTIDRLITWLPCTVQELLG